ncbi:DUF1178 family protein [Acuticoccus sp. M5D2P5]|uniref:DUF1178 family protein n=1 Tax=Acuticoccus kalidii TaxID=2910977 RepID=UPI001F411A76|nr:DUF1178 family protein [Acuticoccus kalidii]MCF3935762.1 DUF1178 family protein [Acuticoccus kalidii]
MIHYTLRCAEGHRFDGWFASSEAFGRQQEGGYLSCPMCGSSDVDRALMSPAIAKGGAEAAAPAHAEGAEATAPQEPSAGANVALTAERDERLRAAFAALRKAVEENGVDVGRNFPEEARRIHYGEAEPRGIYGQADLEEARALVEEGIDVLPLPILPEDRN